MRKKGFTILFILIFAVLFINSVALANRLPFENYRLALRAVEDGNWEQAHGYLDRLITRDYARSNYLAKGIYLKTILLTAEIDRDLRLKDAFTTGYEELDIAEEEMREEFDEYIQHYDRNAKRKVDTLIGLTNYLLSNLPPVEIELDNLRQGRGYSESHLSQVKSGELISETNLNELERDLLSEATGDYFTSTLGLRSDVFDNVHTIRARSGDSLSHISDKYSVPLPLLIRINDHIRNPDRIYPGERIYIPRTSNSYIDYPAYFYHLSHLSYRANPQRRNEVMRMVVKAYQLTGAREQIDSEAKALLYEMEADDYRTHVEQSTDYFEQQDEQLADLGDKYETLIREFSRIIEELGIGEEELEEEDLEEEDLEFDLNY